MTTHVLNTNIIAPSQWYDLALGDAFILLPNISFISWSDDYDTGVFGVAGQGRNSVTIGGTMSVEYVQLFGGDRVVVTRTGTLILDSLEGLNLQALASSGQTRVVNDGSLYSGNMTGANGITTMIEGDPGDYGQLVSILNTGLIDARGIGVKVYGDANGARGSAQIENDGTINGLIAVESSGVADAILNNGVMTASGAAVVRLFGSDIGAFAPMIANTGKLTYTGTVAGNPQNAAIVVTRGDSQASSVEIVNSGLIEGRGRSILLDLDSATIENSGTITGAIKSLGGAVTISNIDGVIRGPINLGDGSDTLANAGTIRGAINMGGGDDMLDLRGGRVLGTAGATGGLGNDFYIVDQTTANIFEDADAGIDTVQAGTSFRLRLNFENLTLLEGADLNGSGNALGNVINGNNSENLLKGLAGNDMIYANSGEDKIEGGAGDDTIYGGLGDDSLIGGFGVDVLTGGGGADSFIFGRGHSDKAMPDTITDFRQGEDVIDLSLIDANLTNALANDAFTFIGSANFTGVAGQLRFGIAAGETFLRGDVNGDGYADFNVKLTGGVALVASDFVF